MGLQLRTGGAWRVAPMDNSRVHYLRVNGTWKPILDMWVRDQGAWHKDPTYSAVLQPPTNIRMNPGDANNHSTIPVAWDWSGVMTPDDFELVLTNEGGQWLQDLAIPSNQRTYTFTGLSTNTRYRVYVRARHSGRAETAWSGPLNWGLGADAYNTQDVPVYGWANEFRWAPTRSWLGYVSSEAVGWPADWALDNNFDSRWVSNNATEPLGDQQGEGMRIRPPYWGHYLVVGVYIYSYGYTATWLGAYNANTGWQGPHQPYFGKYAALRHTYVGAGGGPSSYSYEVRGLAFVSDDPDPWIEVLFQHYTLDAGPGISIWEVQLILQEWTRIRWDVRTVPANPSYYY